uniref:Signal recognition particle 14 kDa protein n=1 Tax=Mesocestoides corti TaxID=53468 RepID=A0A5K3ETH7_MESCO
MLLDNDAFLTALTKMFVESKSGKSLRITMKRYDGKTKPTPRKNSKQPESQATTENSCLMRVALGNKKIATVVHQKDINRFNQAYANVIKANIDGLKKRDKRSGAKGATTGASSSHATKQITSTPPTSSNNV